ncbi:MAG: S9 family peptidase [Proteobacteria bacterium]|nr:S9 family peptidase [Pseudomonadota bacterium]
MRMLLGLLMGAMLAGSAAAAEIPAPPVAPVRPVTDTYFGTKVVDPYRWMENRQDPEFLAWARGQNEHARATLAAIPNRGKLLQRIATLDGATTLIRGMQLAPGILVYEKRRPGDDVYKLYVRNVVSNAETLLLDPNIGVEKGKHQSIDYFSLSPDGKLVAVGVSEGGSEESVLRIIDTTTGHTLPERIDRAEYGSPAWSANSKTFFYNRFAKMAPGAPETDKYLNSGLWQHAVGTLVVRDMPILAVGLNPTVSLTPVDSPFMITAPGSGWALAIISHGNSPENTVYLAPLAQVRPVRDQQAQWVKIADVSDAVTNVALHGDDIYLLSHKDAPRYKILRMKAGDPTLANAQTVVPSGNGVIQDFGVAQDALYFRVLDAGVQKMRRLTFKDDKVSDLPKGPTGGIGAFATSPDVTGVFYPVQTWILPQRWIKFDPAESVASDTGLVPGSSLDTSGYQASEVQAKAADGTLVPLSIVAKKGIRLDGTHPTMLTGYGAYGISLTPSFLSGQLALLERGGVIAIAHVRGGGEFGEDWHLAGKQATKPNTYRDLIACAEYLVSKGYTSPARLAIRGGSAGGITVGMAMTERPDLFRVVLSDVGDSNALRAEYETDGDANSLEYGSTKTEAGFKALYAVDALHHVKDGTAYPATLLTTGINDPRVAPWQPGKMAARLQAANTSGRPVLLRVDYDAGHGIGSTRSQRDELQADQIAFMLWQMGVPEFQPAAVPGGPRG